MPKYSKNIQNLMFTLFFIKNHDVITDKSDLFKKIK